VRKQTIDAENIGKQGRKGFWREKVMEAKDI
jgi:hypothetical protein